MGGAGGVTLIVSVTCQCIDKEVVKVLKKRIVSSGALLSVFLYPGSYHSLL